MLNLRWSWHPPTVELFESIDRAGWAASGGDPVAMLSQMRPGQLAALAANEDFLRRLDAAVADLRRYTGEPRWYESGGAGDVAALPKAIAYFSPEYGITQVLPQYSGGLGILAGDHLKSASDLGVPIIGVGLLYRHGYFTQSLSADGWQAERYPADDPNGLPLTLLRAPSGDPVQVTRDARRGQAAHRPGMAGPGGPGAAADARLLRGGERARTARGHRPAVRRRYRAPAAPGTAARHWRRARCPRLLRDHRAPGARGVPHQRGARRLPRPRADQGVPGRRAVLRRGA